MSFYSSKMSETKEGKGEAAHEPFAELVQVHVARGDTVVLHDITLRIGMGEHVAILGPNGCGKSTLMKVLSSECYPLAGPEMQLRLMGRERWEVQALRRVLGLVGAELPGRAAAKTTGLDAVITGYFGSSTLWPNLEVTTQMREGGADALARMEATHLAKKPLGEMSAGEQRRVMIARSLVHQPKMLLLDEPSNALDLRAQRELRETLRRVARDGTGMVMITHHLPDVLPEMERVLLMREGRVVADGAKAEVLTAEQLSSLFGIAVEVQETGGFYHGIA